VIEAALHAAAVPPFHAMAMSREAGVLEAAGRRILHLEVGQPATPLPVAAREAVRAHLDDPLGYTHATGLHRLRERLGDREGVDPNRIVVVAGASAGFTLAFLTMFEPGARVGVVEPGYPCYRNTLLALGMTPVPLPVGPDSRWAPTAAHLDRAGELDGLVLASPSNPTGTVMTSGALDELAVVCRDRDIAVIGDEIYHGIVDSPASRLLDHHPDALVVNSFSKYWSMTGWRVGWMVVPDRVVDTVERLQQNLYICAPHVSQVAALAALDATDELEAHVARYRENRKVLIDGLASAGIEELAPADGAFYVYAHVPHLTTDLGIDSLGLTRRWLHETGVAATSGIDFDLVRGHEYVRFSYAGTVADMSEACARLARWSP
jgi:aspartate/methionine/tyrosine aminotransferase